MKQAMRATAPDDDPCSVGMSCQVDTLLQVEAMHFDSMKLRMVDLQEIETKGWQAEWSAMRFEREAWEDVWNADAFDEERNEFADDGDCDWSWQSTLERKSLLAPMRFCACEIFSSWSSGSEHSVLCDHLQILLLHCHWELASRVEMLKHV
jgi:hypothetical protein